MRLSRLRQVPHLSQFTTSIANLICIGMSLDSRLRGVWIRVRAHFSMGRSAPG